MCCLRDEWRTFVSGKWLVVAVIFALILGQMKIGVMSPRFVEGIAGGLHTASCWSPLTLNSLNGSSILRREGRTWKVQHFSGSKENGHFPVRPLFIRQVLCEMLEPHSMLRGSPHRTGFYFCKVRNAG